MTSRRAIVRHVARSTTNSREQAGHWAAAAYYTAGETSTAVCSIPFTPWATRADTNVRP